MNTKSQNSSHKAVPAGIDAEPEWLKLVRENVTALRFGVVQITVQDGRVVLIERTDKLRFDKPA